MSLLGRRIKVCWLALSWVVAAPVAGAGFTLNFNHNGTVVAGPGGGDIAKGQTFGPSGGNDGTRFIQDTVTIDGQDYFHVVVIDANSDFRQESYTASVLQSFTRTGGRSYSPYSGGMERSVIGDQSVVNMNRGPIQSWLHARVGNAKDPFGYRLYSDSNDKVGTVQAVSERYRISGNGTMDPTRVVLLMKLSDASVSMEVYKPQLDRKPRVTQNLVEGGLTARFIADMRGLLYSDLSRAAPVINTMTLDDPGLPTPGAADFDMSFAQNAHVTAGKYSYTPGLGWRDATTNAPINGWDVNNSRFYPGTYTYSDGNFDVLNVDWTQFFDPTQNPNSQVNLN